MAGLLAGLAACAAPPAPAPGWRDPARPIASAALFDADRFAGTWHVVARYPRPAGAACADETLTHAPGAMRWACTGADGAPLDGWSGAAEPGRWPGRFTLGAGAQEGPGIVEVWVLWVDVDYRTAVIGTPDGSAGLILDRNPSIPPDRMVAAREMLDFNGYDLSHLVASGR
ncbi:MAG: lipocalin family protein [Rubellimicrobium sp.]|nr:lipocalin family protein [Rubellimicrobium sp.]